MKYAILVAMLLTGCATPSFRAAGCVRFYYKSWNILACNDEAVSRHCAKWIHKLHGKLDSGKEPTGQETFAGCYRPAWWGRKGNIIIGKSYAICLPHEIAHAEGVRADIVERDYPCMGW